MIHYQFSETLCVLRDKLCSFIDELSLSFSFICICLSVVYNDHICLAGGHMHYDTLTVQFLKYWQRFKLNSP